MQARALVHRGAVSAAADAALALGPTRTPHPQQETPTAAQHRAEDPHRSTQRAAVEHKLTRPAAPASATVPPTPPATTSPATTPAPPTTKPRPPAAAQPMITVESAATAAERVQHLVQPADSSRRQRGSAGPCSGDGSVDPHQGDRCRSGPRPAHGAGDGQLRARHRVPGQPGRPAAMHQRRWARHRRGHHPRSVREPGRQARVPGRLVERAEVQQRQQRRRRAPGSSPAPPTWSGLQEFREKFRGATIKNALPGWAWSNQNTSVPITWNADQVRPGRQGPGARSSA